MTDFTNTQKLRLIKALLEENCFDDSDQDVIFKIEAILELESY